MSYKVDKKIIRLTGLQTLPGKEFPVVQEITDEFEQLKKLEEIENYSIFKGLGAFDVIYLYEAPSLDYHVSSRFGPIKGILHSTQFFCFPFLFEGELEDFGFDTLLKAPFVGFSLLKIDPYLSLPSLSIEYSVNKNILKLLSKTDVKSLMFGTLGWYEIILLFWSDDIETVIDSLFWATGQSIKPNIIKTHSFVSINHKLFSEEGITDDTSSNELKAILSRNKLLNKKIAKKYDVSIGLCCEPQFSNIIGNYWENNDFKVKDFIGEKDILITRDENDKNETWGVLIASLLSSRSDLKGNVLQTHTNISRLFTPVTVDENGISPKSTRSTKKNKLSVVHRALDCIAFIKGSPKQQKTGAKQGKTETSQYKFSDLERIFGQKEAIVLDSHFKSLNGLIQNPLIGSAFAGMSSYPEYIIYSGPNYKKKNREKYLAKQAIDVIKFGVESRLYGTHGTSINPAGQFSEFRGGKQRALLAIESLPKDIFRRLGGIWQGFVISSPYRFSRLNSVINIPSECLLNPKYWWGIYHEIAHVWIDHFEDLTKKDSDEMRIFIAQSNSKYDPYNQAVEMMAELIGFEIGFYNNFDLFMNLLWNYLEDIYVTEKKYDMDSVEVLDEIYILRTFFVFLYKSLYTDEKIDKDNIFNNEYIYDELIKHIKNIEFITKRKRKNKYFIASENTDYFRSFYPQMELFHNKVKGFNLTKNISEIDDEKTLEVVSCIKRGEVYEDKMLSPEAVLYNIFDYKSKLLFNQSMATILSFWNNYKFLSREPEIATF